MKKSLEDAQDKRNVLKQILDDIELKLEGLSVDKETYA
jgi:hypothetical protein